MIANDWVNVSTIVGPDNDYTLLNSYIARSAAWAFIVVWDDGTNNVISPATADQWDFTTAVCFMALATPSSTFYCLIPAV